MGSSKTSLARRAVAHGERRSGLLEKIASGGRSRKAGWLSMLGKVGSRLFLSGGSRFGNVGPEVVSATSLVEVGSAGGSRYPDSLSGFAGRYRISSYHDVHSMETAICVGSVLFVLMLFAAHYKFCP